jgi:hypothetical protein
MLRASFAQDYRARLARRCEIVHMDESGWKRRSHLRGPGITALRILPALPANPAYPEGRSHQDRRQGQ